MCTVRLFLGGAGPYRRPVEMRGLRRVHDTDSREAKSSTRRGDLSVLKDGEMRARNMHGVDGRCNMGRSRFSRR